MKRPGLAELGRIGALPEIELPFINLRAASVGDLPLLVVPRH